MPTLPLPIGDNPLAGGDLPVTDGSDVLKELPAPHRVPTVAPVRDALCDAFAAGHREYQARVEYAVAQCDPLQATGAALRELAEEHGVIPAVGESNEALRARIYATPTIVTPDAISETVNAIIAPYTDSTCRVYEPSLDGWFLNAGTSVWHSFVDNSPQYLDRLYEDDAADNDGIFFDGDPGAARPSRGEIRTFIIRVPSIESADSDFAFEGSWFLDDSTDPSTVHGFVFGNTETSDELYNNIVGAVNRIKGQGIAWALIVDSNL